MLLKPRDYQVEAVDSIYRYFTNHTGNPVIAMPTGTGKSVVIALFLESAFRLYGGQRVMVLTHVKELIEQNYQKLLSMWPNAPAGIYSAGLNRRDVWNNIVFGGIASVVRRAKQFGKIDLLIIDEAHLVSPKANTMYQRFINELKSVNPYLKVIGLTATPWRLGQGSIIEEGGLFTDICFDITHLRAFNRLIEEGYLSPLIPRQTQQIIDVDGVRIQGGEFVQSELQHAVDRDEITAGAIEEILREGENRNHWLIFASGIEHAEHIGQMLDANGVSNVVIHSKMDDKKRDQGLEDFKAGRVRAAINNNVLTTGFDFPGIDLIAVLRPTASPVLWVQMLGRGTRPVYADGFALDTAEDRLAAIAASSKQNCLVLDFAGNTRRLGPINDPLVPGRKGKRRGMAPVKTCAICNTYNHTSVRQCVCCGAEFHFEVKIKKQASTQDLIKGDAPIVETFEVSHITYTKHEKVGKPPMIAVSYYCGLRMFKQYVCLEHPGFAGRKAREWWRERSSRPAPTTTSEGLDRVDELAAPTHIRVWINKKYPEVLACCFDGSAFGAQPATGPKRPQPQYEPAEALPPTFYGDANHDDIPF